MKAKAYHSLNILLAAVLLLGGIAPIFSTPAHAQGDPDFGVNLAGNSINGWN